MFLLWGGAGTREDEAFSSGLQLIHWVNENINYIPHKKISQKQLEYVAIHGRNEQLCMFHFKKVLL